MKTRMLQKKRTFSVLRGAILLTLMVVGLISILSACSTAHDSEVVPLTGALGHYPDPSSQDGLPDSMKVTGNGEIVLLRASVTQGYQVYECQVSKTAPSGFAWNLQAPFANLAADAGTNVIHSTGPTWLYTLDGSQIKGKVGQYTNPDGTLIPASTTPDASAIPWLRIDVTDHLGNSGLFSRVSQIQRLYTAGGKAPSDVCNLEKANKHITREISYTAEYVFWGI